MVLKLDPKFFAMVVDGCGCGCGVVVVVLPSCGGAGATIIARWWPEGEPELLPPTLRKMLLTLGKMQATSRKRQATLRKMQATLRKCHLNPEVWSHDLKGIEFPAGN